MKIIKEVINCHYNLFILTYFENKSLFNYYIFSDYLKSAICIKSAAIEESGCKSFYDSLLNEINSPSESETLCW